MFSRSLFARSAFSSSRKRRLRKRRPCKQRQRKHDVVQTQKKQPLLASVLNLSPLVRLFFFFSRSKFSRSVVCVFETLLRRLHYSLISSYLSVQFTENSLTGYRQRRECLIVRLFIEIDKLEHHFTTLFVYMIRFKVSY